MTALKRESGPVTRAAILETKVKAKRGINTTTAGPAQNRREGAFAGSAASLWRAGLLPIPLGGADGKKPLICGFTTMPRPTLATIEAWSKRAPRPSVDAMGWARGTTPGANVGIVTGAVSGVTVVDIDSGNPAILEAVERRFGRTPLQVTTPRGGRHLYYRHNGEGCRNLRPELPVDVKGNGGYVVAPPSVRPSGGTYGGKAYAIASGASWTDLERLQPIKEGALAPAPAEPARLRAVGAGRRNNTLFRALLKHAPACDDLEAVLDVAQTINSNCTPPLPQAEVEKTARSAWRYEAEGRNGIGHEARNGGLTRHEIREITAQGGAEAVTLLLILRLEHWHRPEFYASPVAMARARLLPGGGRTATGLRSPRWLQAPG